jgi:hypothetical protein
MSALVRLASPWWVNLLILVPALPFLLLRKKVLIAKKRLAAAALFGISFAFVEAAVVVYLRAATGLWPDPTPKVVVAIPENLLRIECSREAATLVMLFVISWLSGQSVRERIMAFLWTFAFWDFFYYVWLRVAIGWPGSLLDTDVLFLIPTPWIAQVWFPLLVSFLTALAVWFHGSKTGPLDHKSPQLK